MPTYQVRCTTCEHTTEVVHRMSEDHPPCSECGKELKTYFPMGTQLPKTQFKGTGWACKGD